MKTRYRMTAGEYMQLHEDGAGICEACGRVQACGIEPDAEDYECEHYGEYAVLGMEEDLLRGRIEITQD
jgi:hypothetical protein